MTALALVSLSGCAVVGPAAIANGRGAYVDVITRTNDEQLLNLIVRMRYAEPCAMVTVSGITAQTEMGVNAGGQVGVGPSSNYAGNLVPFAIDGHYRETPTISYTPVTGERFLKELLTPIELDLFVLLLQAAPNERQMLDTLVASLGRLEAPVYRDSRSRASLRRAVVIIAELTRQGSMDMSFRADSAKQIVGVDVSIHDWSTTAPEETRELMGLLGRTLPPDASLPITFSLQTGRGLPTDSTMPIRVRCPMELLQIATLGVAIPEDHSAQRIAIPQPVDGPKPFLTIHSSTKPPKDPAVAIQYRGHWFWIASDDVPSKQGFNLLQMLLMRCLEGQGSQTPLLSLPIG